jgi:gas vesicle protein
MQEKGFGILGVILAFTGGALAGAATALLLAPATGSDTRDQIKRFATDTTKNIMDKASDLKQPFRKKLETATRNGSV